MALYSIDYDLHQPDRDYPKIEAAIMSYGTYCHVLLSHWIIQADQSSSKEIRNYLAQHIDRDDSLIVSKLTGEHAWQGLPEKIADWLRSVTSS